MKKEEIKQFFSEILSRIPDDAPEPAPVKPKRWRAEYEGGYFYTHDDGEIMGATDRRDVEDNHRYNSNNYAQTEEELREKEACKLLAIQMRDEEDGEGRFTVRTFWSSGDRKWHVIWREASEIQPSDYRFTTDERAEDFYNKHEANIRRCLAAKVRI